jgi:plastocyanin
VFLLKKEIFVKIAFYLLLLCAVMVIPLAAGSCNSTASTTSTSPTGPQGENFEVTIQGEAFSPPSVNVPRGTTVHWVNHDSMTHTVTSDTGLFDSKNMSEGSNFSHTFSEKGTFTYHCAVHTFMKGTVIVE